jgi:hypothetical protein
MPGSLKGFVALVKQKNPGIIFTPYFLQWEALISKSIVSEVQNDWMRRSKWLTTTRVGHYNGGFQHSVLPLKLLTHNSYCTRKWGG